MNLLLIIYALVIGALVYNLWRPRYAPSRIAAASFLAGLVFNLFALHILVIHIAVTALIGLWIFWWGPLTLAALGLCFATAAGLLIYHLKGYDVANVVEAALRKGLGDDYRHRVRADIAARFPAGLDMRRIIRPFPQDLPGVEITKNVAYGNDPIQKLDIYRAGPGEAKPVLLQIHGGAWTEKLGSKNEQARPLMNHMAERGWICVSVGYRLSPGATLPEHIIDVKNALLWVKANIEQYGGDPNFVIATGGSAGGHLSSLLALSEGDPLFQPDAPEADTSVQGCVPYYGAVDFFDDSGSAAHDNLTEFLTESVIKQSPADAPDLWNALSSMRRIHADAPPFFVICGDKDTLVPEGSNAAFAEKLGAESAQDVCYAKIPGAQHAFDMTRTPHSEYVVHAIERWLGYQYSRYLEG